MADFCWTSFVVALPVTALAVVVVLGIALLVAMRVGKHAVVDVAWGLGFAVIAATAYGTSFGADDRDPARAALIVGLTVVWGVRLGTHVWLRSRGKGEDPRYAALLERAPGNPTAFAVRRIYLTQGLIMYVVSLPVQVAVFETAEVGWLGLAGVAVWAVGFAFETVGDLQLTRFRNDPGTEGQVLDTGLWRYTRHPNYFGDACVWWGLSLIAFEAWPGILTMASPILMTWLLAKGTGKPLLEKDMAERRPGYADYVRRTSGFIPLPPRARTSRDPDDQPRGSTR